MQYITKIQNCDIKLINFLFITDIIKLCLVNLTLNILIMNQKINKSIIQLQINIHMINIFEIKKFILEKCYRKGLICILQNYHQFNNR